MSTYTTAINFIAICVFLSVTVLPVLVAISILRGDVRETNSTTVALLMFLDVVGLADLVASLDKKDNSVPLSTPAQQLGFYLSMIYVVTILLGQILIQPENLGRALLIPLVVLWNFASWLPVEISGVVIVGVMLYLILQREGFTDGG